MNTARFLVFGSESEHGALGGWDDFQGAFEDLEKARDYCKNWDAAWMQIVDIQERRLYKLCWHTHQRAQNFPTHRGTAAPMNHVHAKLI